MRRIALLLFFLPLLAAAAPAGLDSLSDDSLRAELANDGLSTLLERAFVADNVPDDQRAAERAVIALRQLADPSLSAQDKSARLAQIVAGINGALPRLNSPRLLLGAGAILVEQGVQRDVNTMEYFGEDGADAAKARLAPNVNTAIALYDRAIKILDQRQSALQDQIARPGDDAALAWQKTYQDFQTASYTRWMLAYAQVLSMDRADLHRAEVAQTAIDHLKQWDDPSSGVQAAVRLQIGKLNMLRGTHADLLHAREYFNTLVTPRAIDPAPDKFTQFNALYFYAVSDVLDSNAEAAEHDAQTAEELRQNTLAGVDGDAWAMAMLRYRIALLRGDNDKAVKILEDLSDQAPGLRPVIAAELLDKLPPHADLSTLSPLMLQALIERAWTELAKPSPDPTTLQQGLSAAKQYLRLADQSNPQTTPQETIDASKIRGVILKSLAKPAEAAAAFLDHAERYKLDPNAQADQAISAAIAQLGVLYKSSGAEDHQTDINALEDRLLPLAVESFHRYDLAYDYARHLQRDGHSAKAARVFDLVPSDDPNADNAPFFTLIALADCLQAPARDAENAVAAADVPKVLKQVQSLADRVIAAARSHQSAAATPEARRPFLSMRVHAALLAADLAARRGNDPKRALALLDGLGDAMSGLPDSADLQTQALKLRISADMRAGDSGAATETLVRYLSTVGGDEGLRTVYGLLTQLNQELDRAQAAGEAARVRELTDDRAALTPFLVQWASSNSNPDISKYTYRYRVFDAATQQQAAELEADAAQRSEKLASAMARYQELQSPENVKLYQATLPPDAAPEVRDQPDPQVTLGIGDVAFAQGDWKQAHDCVGELLADSRLGDGTIVVKDAAGRDQTQDNEQFWKAQYDFIYSTAQLAKDPSSGVDAKTAGLILDRLKAVWQDRMGGVKYRQKFEELDNELAEGAGKKSD